MPQQRDDQVQVLGRPDDAEDLDSRTHHHVVLEREGVESNNTRALGEARDLRRPFLDELTEQIQVPRTTRMAPVPLELLAVWPVEDEPLPDGIARFGYQTPRGVRSVVSHCQSVQRLAVQRCGRRQAGAAILRRHFCGDHIRCNVLAFTCKPAAKPMPRFYTMSLRRD